MALTGTHSSGDSGHVADHNLIDAQLAAASASYQPLDSDLTAIAALSTTSYGRALLALADAAAGRTALGLGTAATQASTAFDAAGAASAAQAASQPVDSDLTAIAALTTTSYGRGFLALADAAAARTAVSLGNVDNTSDATKPVSTAQVAAFQPKNHLDSAGTDWAIGQLVSSGTNVYRVTTAHTGTFDLTKAASVGGSASKVNYGEMSTLNFVGHSYLTSPGARCTSGLEQHQRLKARLFSTAPTLRAFSGDHTADTAFYMLGGRARTNGAWTPGTTGIAVVDAITNAMIAPSVDNGATATALDTGGVNVFTQALRTILAVASSSAVTQVATGGTNWAFDSQTLYSGGRVEFTNTQNAFVDTTVTVPASGILYLVTYIQSGMGSLSVKVGATTYATLTAADSAAAYTQWRTSNGSASFSFSPTVLKITGLPVGSQTIRLTKTDAGAGYIYGDCFLTPSTAPPLVLIMKDPVFDTAKTGVNAVNTTGNAPTLAANKALLDAALPAVTTEFTNATVVDPALIAADLGADGVHPNDRGMRKEADAMQTAIAAYVGASDIDGLYVTR